MKPCKWWALSDWRDLYHSSDTHKWYKLKLSGSFVSKLSESLHCNQINCTRTQSDVSGPVWDAVAMGTVWCWMDRRRWSCQVLTLKHLNTKWMHIKPLNIHIKPFFDQKHPSDRHSKQPIRVLVLFLCAIRGGFWKSLCGIICFDCISAYCHFSFKCIIYK